MSKTDGVAADRIYILARRDLSYAQRAVQSCHALAELMRKHGDDPSVREWADKHKTLVIMGVRDLAELLRWEQKLRDARTAYEAFTEADLGNEKTAIAIHPAADSCLFRNLCLL